MGLGEWKWDGRAPATNGDVHGGELQRRTHGEGRKRMAGLAVGEGELVGAAAPFIEEEREGERALGREKKRPAIATPLMAINGGLH
jgi:hypothetical protein